MRRMPPIMAILVFACGGTAGITAATSGTIATTAPPTTTTQAAATTTTTPTTTTLSQTELDQMEYEADVELIKDLWRDHSDSWASGVEAAYAHIAENDYPGLGCTIEDLRTHYGYEEGTEHEMIVDADTIERDNDWIGPDLGSVPEGRIYIYQMTHNLELPGLATQSRLIEVHATVLSDRAYFFIECR